MKMILLGAPGAGKGTQAERLCKVLNIPTISTGNILRAAVKNGTPTGKQAEAYMKAGKLVPDEVIIGIIHDRLDEDDCKNGYILDGVPRTLAQAEALEAKGVRIDHVISIEVDDNDIARRMGGRRVCSKCGASYHVVAKPPKTEGVCDSCGGELIIRKDDAPETVLKRLAVYHASTEVLKDYYAKLGRLHTVNGNQSIEGANEEILKAIGAKA